MESLSDYIAHIIKEKDLKVIDIQRRSGDRIKDSYITSLMRGGGSEPFS